MGPDILRTEYIGDKNEHIRIDRREVANIKKPLYGLYKGFLMNNNTVLG